MLDDICKASANYRLEKAHNCLKAAETLLESGAYADSANRSYYCIFHAIRAVLITYGFSAKTHSGIITEFRRRYIKTGLFPIEFSDMIGNAFEIRNDSDYEDFSTISESEALQQIENAKLFLEAVKEFIDNLPEDKQCQD